MREPANPGARRTSVLDFPGWLQRQHRPLLFIYFLFLFISFIFSFWGHPSAYGVPGPGIRSEQSLGPKPPLGQRSSSFTPCPWPGIESVSQRSRDATHPSVQQGEPQHPPLQSIPLSVDSLGFFHQLSFPRPSPPGFSRLREVMDADKTRALPPPLSVSPLPSSSNPFLPLFLLKTPRALPCILPRRPPAEGLSLGCAQDEETGPLSAFCLLFHALPRGHPQPTLRGACGGVLGDKAHNLRQSVCGWRWFILQCAPAGAAASQRDASTVVH